mmetsp:Transcript_50666/g.141449  ORF Transcript_50666/g.141449 Transcript_50666/m.141449 type:complete len:481 (-) Transcript_50666:226-1668(-)
MLVSPHNLERYRGHLHRAPDVEVPQLEVPARIGVPHPPLLGELAGLVSTIARLQLKDCHLVVGGVVSYNERSHHILRLAMGHLRLEAADLPGEGHKLDEVYLRLLRPDGVDVADGVLLPADADVGRRVQLPVPHRLLADVDLARLLVDPQELLVELGGEVVAVVQDDLPIPHVDGIPDLEVFGQVGDRVGGEHAGDGDAAAAGLVQRRAPHEDWVIVTPRVAAVSLVYLHGVVREVIVDDKIHPSTVQRSVVPKGLESQDLSVVQQELGEFLVNYRLARRVLGQLLRFMGTASHRKTALLRGLLELVGLRPVVFLSRLIVTHVDAVLLEEPAREAVAAVHKIRPLVQGELLAAADVVRTQKAHAVILGAPVPLQERALRNTRVLDLRLDDLDGSILQVVHDLHVAETAVLVRPLRHRLLEVGVKTQDLPVVLQPGGGVPRMDHVLRNPGDPLLLDVQLGLVLVVGVNYCRADREARPDHL